MMSRALYENKFPCQAIWRMQEKIDTSLDLPKVKLIYFGVHSCLFQQKLCLPVFDAVDEH